MVRFIHRMLIGLLLASHVLSASVRIYQLRGDIRIRHGLEEVWYPAGIGMDLEQMDSIFSGEASEVVLILEDGNRFTLGSNAVLDISDLRRITERQLFLYLMSQKVEKLNIPEPASKIHIANVSVVRGAQKGGVSHEEGTADPLQWKLEINGAKALLSAAYYPNAIMKFYKILEHYPSLEDQGDIHYHLGQAFEALEENGRACDAYQTALERMESTGSSSNLRDRSMRIQEALKRLKSDSSMNGQGGLNDSSP